MHSLQYFVLLVSLPLLLTQCSDSDEGVFTQAGVTTRVADETIVIENNHGKPISYFAVEDETAQLIDWTARSGPENTINNRTSKVIPWDDIMSDSSLERDDRVIIYWWPAQDSTLAPANTFQNIVEL